MRYLVAIILKKAFTRLSTLSGSGVHARRRPFKKVHSDKEFRGLSYPHASHRGGLSR